MKPKGKGTASSVSWRFEFFENQQGFLEGRRRRLNLVLANCGMVRLLGFDGSKKSVARLEEQLPEAQLIGFRHNVFMPMIRTDVIDLNFG